MMDKECVPFAPALIESMRSLGYSFPTAIADLIDNSISAQSTCIDIYSAPSNDPYLIILDNGHGMSENEIYEAMRFGSTNPLDERDKEDLGRFGLGLKSASLSQCRRFVVVSKKGGKLCAYSWNLDHVIESKAWMLERYSEQEIIKLPYINLLANRNSGTYIMLSNFDRLKSRTSNIQETFTQNLDDMINHLSLVFHRFIEDGLNIYVNKLKIEAKDPFLVYHRATQKKRESSFNINGEKIILKPFILPHISKLTQDDWNKIGGKEKLRSDQGFYVYRNRRLIIWGTWFRLEKKDELNKLARVMVDIPNSLDYMWSIDIKKSTAYLPDIIKKNMYNAVYESIISSEAVHTYRGRKEKSSNGNEYIWEKIKIRDGYGYQINREIPQLKILKSELDEYGLKLLNSLLNTIEGTLPLQALYVDVAKGNIEEKKENEEIIDELWLELQTQMDFIKKKGLPEKDFYQMFMKVEPYCNYIVIVDRIKENLKNYE